MTPPKRCLLFLLLALVAVVALALHRWPWTRPTRIDLAEVQQRVEALRQEVEPARAAPDPADAYTPQTPGSIAPPGGGAPTPAHQDERQ